MTLAQHGKPGGKVKRLWLFLIAAAMAAAQSVGPIPGGGATVTSPSTNGTAYWNGSTLTTTATGGAGTLCLTSTGGAAPVYSSCSGSAATAWSALTSPTGNLSLSVGTDTTQFIVGTGTSTNNPFSFIDTTGNTGTGALVEIHSVGTSTIHPFQVTAQGTANGVQVSAAGVLAPLGSGVINATNVIGGGANQIPYQTGATTTSFISAVNNAVLVTNGSGVPSESTTLPTGLAMQTPASINLSNGTALPCGALPALTGDTTTSAGACATTTAKINGTAFAGTNGDLVSFGAANTPADSAIAAANLVTAASNFTNAAMVIAAGSNKTTSSWADFTISSHTGSLGASGILDLSGASLTAGFKTPAGAGAAPTVDGILSFNTTTHARVWGSNGTTIVGAAAATGTNSSTTCTNQVFTVISGIAAPTCTTLTSTYLPAAVVYNNQANTYTTGLQNFASGNIELPAGAGFTATSSNNIGYDTTNTNVHVYDGADAIVAPFASAPTTGHCVQATVSSGKITLSDSGSSNCGGGGSTALSSIGNATTTNTISNGNNGAQIWNWALTSNSLTAFTFGESAAATGTSDLLLKVATAAGSTAVPLTVSGSLTGSQTLSALSITPTWNTSGVVDAALLVNVTNTASGAASLLADYQVGGTSQGKLDKSGNWTVTGNIVGASLSTGTSPPTVTAGTGGGSAYGEGTAPSVCAATAADCVYADSTQHGLLASFNNGSYLPLTQGPASATNGDLPSFNGTNGGLFQDSNIAAANVVTAASNYTSGAMVVGGGANKTTASWADFTVSSHTGSMGASGLMDLHSATGADSFRVPVFASAAAGVTGSLTEDATGKNYHVYANGADSIIAPFAVTALPSNGDCVQSTVSASNYLLSDAGAKCVTGTAYQTILSGGASITQRSTVNFISGSNATVSCIDNSGSSRTDCTVSASSSAGSRLDQISAATGANTIQSGDNAQIWQWLLTSSGKSAFTFTEPSASSAAGTPWLININTVSSSTVNPFIVTAQGTANGVAVLKSSFLTSEGTGGVDSNMLFCDVTTSTKCIKNVLSGITASNTRNITWQDAAITVAGTALSAGGTNANLTASNGGIVYSTASALAILAGTSTANQVLLSGASTTPAWSTATYPATTTINQILYSSSANTIAGITTGNGGLLNTNGSGVPAITATPAIGTDNSVAGTLQMANGSANAHTIWSSGATTTNTIQGFATVPTTGHLVDCTVTSTTCLFHDSGVVTANVVNASSPGVGIAHFAGSTQTVTSSLIVAADITSGTITGTQIASSIALAGSPTTTTQSACDNSTKLATTAYLSVTCTNVETSGSPLSATAQSQVILNNTTSAYVVDLPTPVVGMSICVGNADARTSAVSLVPGSGVTIYYKGVAGTSGSSTGLVSGGAAGDFICVVASSTTHWNTVGAGQGVWTNN